MNVILRSTRGDQREALAPRNATEICKELGRAGDGNDRTPISGAEDTMDEIAGVRVRHLAPSLRDSHFTIAVPYPKLKRGANKQCAYGANPPSTLPKIESTLPNCRV